MIKINGSVVLDDPNVEPVIKSFRDLKTQIRQAKDELAGLEQGTEEYNRAAVRVGALTDKMKNLNKTIAQTSGAPLENLNSSFGILSSQIRSLDFDGVGSSLSTLWTTIAANPLLAVAGLVSLLVANFDELKKLLPFVTEEVIDNTKAVEANKAALELNKEATDNYIKSLENERKVLELSNASKKQLQKLDRQIADEKIKQIQNEIATRQKNLENLLVQNKKEADALRFLTNVQSARLKTEQGLAEARQRIAENNQTVASIKAERAAIKALSSEIALLNAEYIKSTQVKPKEKIDQVKPKEKIDIAPITDDEIQDLTTKAVNGTKAVNDKVTEANQSFYNNGIAQRTEFNVIMGQLADGLANETFETERQLAQGIAGIGEIIYQTKTKNLKKGSKEEQEAARKSFELEKGLRIANATTAGIEGGIQAFTRGTSLGGPILGGLFAAAAAASALAGIIKIKNTKFTPTGQSANVSSSISPSIPNTQPQPLAPAPQTDLNEQGQSQGFNPFVSVKEINNKQQRVKVLETRASY